MTDEATLLAAIIARPLDDLPRLCYADEMEKTAGMVPCHICHKVLDCYACHGTGEVSSGRAERAEFIRVQRELAWHKCPQPNRKPKRRGLVRYKCERCDALRRRERALLFDHGFKWGREAVPVPAGYKHTRGDDNDFHVWSNENLDGMRYSFRRGFIESLTCSWSDFRTHADAIRKATPLRKVRTDMPEEERWKCWTFSPPHAETFLRHPDYKGIEFEMLPQEGGTLVTFNIPVRNPRYSFVMRAE